MVVARAGAADAVISGIILTCQNWPCRMVTIEPRLLRMGWLPDRNHHPCGRIMFEWPVPLSLQKLFAKYLAPRPS